MFIARQGAFYIAASEVEVAPLVMVALFRRGFPQSPIRYIMLNIGR
jgi:hypothetical protein